MRGGCEERISFCWWNPVILITTSHHLCPAEFIISWCYAGPLLALLLFLSVSLLLDPSLKNKCNIVLCFIFNTWLKMSTCEGYIFTFELHMFLCDWLFSHSHVAHGGKKITLSLWNSHVKKPFHTFSHVTGCCLMWTKSLTCEIKMSHVNWTSDMLFCIEWKL